MQYFCHINMYGLAKNITILFFTLLLPFIAFTQGKEANIWYFGRNAGLSFEYGNPIILTNGAIFTNEGCASICDSAGRLLFYTDGVSVYNRSHRKMPNGVGLKGNSSTSQSAIIIPRPGTTTEYYIFTVDCKEMGLKEGLCFSKVDMTLDNGLGDVVTAEKNIQLVGMTCEKVTAVAHGDGRSYWVITKIFGNADFHAYRVSGHGVDMNPVVSTTGPPITVLYYHSAGCLKVSHDGKWLVSVNCQMGVDFHRFDNLTGKVTHVASESSTLNLFGVEFSPNNKYVYVSQDDYDDPSIYQYDVSSGDSNTILNSKLDLKQDLDHANPPGDLQLGPDNRIYIALVSGKHLARINKPDLRGNRCQIEADVCYLKGKYSFLGLPQFIQSFFFPIDFTAEPICSTGPTGFSIVNPAGIDSVKWEFNDSVNSPHDTSTLLYPFYQFSHAGTFYVKLTAWSELGIRTTTDTVIIFQGPEANFPLTNPTHDTIYFENTFLLEATPGYASYEWNTGDTIYYVNVTQEGEYTVTMKTTEGCQSIESVYMLETFVPIQVPNAFTPNGDGLNDIFKPVVNTELVRQYRLSIYNKWGQLIFETNNAGKGWDGENAMPGVYVWVISYANRVGRVFEMRGRVTLVK